MRKGLFVMAAAGMLAMAAGCSTMTQAETVSEGVAQMTADDSSKTQVQGNIQETAGEIQTIQRMWMPALLPVSWQTETGSTEPRNIWRK